MAWTNPSADVASLPKSCPCKDCIHFEIITNPKRAINPTRYYCRDKQHGFFEPKRVRKCDMHKTHDEIAIKLKKFNRGIKL